MTEKVKEYQNIINESIVIVDKENAYVPQNILMSILADHETALRKLNINKCKFCEHPLSDEQREFCNDRCNREYQAANR